MYVHACQHIVCINTCTVCITTHTYLCAHHTHYTHTRTYMHTLHTHAQTHASMHIYVHTHAHTYTHMLTHTANVHPTVFSFSPMADHHFNHCIHHVSLNTRARTAVYFHYPQYMLLSNSTTVQKCCVLLLPTPYKLYGSLQFEKLIDLW